MITRDKIDLYHKKIANDRLFSASGRNGMLLDYLIKKALAGEQIKEYTIGSDLFKKNYKSDSEDGIVRVHIYNLRKRLQQYYQGSGQNDVVQFVLKKGDYNIQFVDQQSSIKRPLRRRYIAAFVALLLSILAIVTYFITRYDYYCWQTFLAEDRLTNCVIADQIVMIKHEDGVITSLTHPDVVNLSDFTKYVKNNPTETLTLPNYTTYTKAIPHCIQRLTQWFLEHDRVFNIINESSFTIEESRTANTLYIGQFKTMNLSRELFLRNSNLFGLEANNFYSIKDGEKLVHRAMFAAGKREYEYAMVSYFSMEGGFDALYFVSNNDIGTMSVVSKFSDPKFLESFYQKLPSKSSYFNALFKIEGINRTDLSCELVELEVVE